MGRRLAVYLGKPNSGYVPLATSDPRLLAATLEPADVLLVEGNTRFSTAIKYLTQSTWSHAALYIGSVPGLRCGSAEQEGVLVEADVVEGVRPVPLSTYSAMHTRVCRPVGLSDSDRQEVVAFALASIGKTYDLKNVWDLARYLLPTPPVPVRWRRRMLSLGSGEPTKAICSSIIAQAFQHVRYPILPRVEVRRASTPACRDCLEELYLVRHHSLFTPRDFDISPYFQVVKPAIETRFDYRTLKWGSEPDRLAVASNYTRRSDGTTGGPARMGARASAAAGDGRPSL